MTSPRLTRLTRRQFVAGGCAAGVAGAAGLAVARHPWTRTASSRSQTASATAGKGVLVLVTLYGGNDGLNTVIPYTDSQYLAGRPTLGFRADEVLPLSDGMGLHPNLKGLKALWDAKQLAIVRGVGYPNPVRSHFRSMDIWQSGSPDQAVATGWLGRWLDATGTDPMRALSIGSTLPRLLAGERQAGAAIAGTAAPWGAGGAGGAGGARLGLALAALDGPGPDRTGLAARVATSGADFLKVQHTLADLLGGSPGSASTPAPAKPARAPGASGVSGRGQLAAQLDVVAKLIKAGSPTKVYQVAMNGFDNHSQEKDTHARLMGQLDDGIAGFFQALQADAAMAGVTLMTYSEFGRRVAQNASGGTDHGTAAPLFVTGTGVRGGHFYGDQPSLSALDQGDLHYTTDFRSVYATVLARVVGVDPKVALGSSFPPLAFL
jgi:uncharacterized protein (DUF1501 family)